MLMWVKNIWDKELRLWFNAKRVIFRPGDVGQIDDNQAWVMIKSGHLEEVIPGAASKPVADKQPQRVEVKPAAPKKKVVARKKVVVRKKAAAKRRSSIQDALR